MILVFEANSTDKAKLTAMLELDPYAKTSFSRNGYTLKDGVQVGQDKEKVYVFMNATDEFAKFARATLAGIATECKPEVASAVAAKIAEAENNAQVGFGSIFG